MNSDTPKTIWLQFEDDLIDPGYALDGATWCVDKINASDTEYVRADQLTAARATIARLEGEKYVLNTNEREGWRYADELKQELAAKEAELQTLQRQLDDPEPRPCCGKYETCLRPCTPRGEWRADCYRKGTS